MIRQTRSQLLKFGAKRHF